MGARSLISHPCAALLGAVLAGVAPGAASRDGLAWENDRPGRLEIGYRNLANSRVEGISGEIDGASRTTGGVAWQSDSGLHLSAQHSYDAIGFDLPATSKPPTTGDLHTLNLGVGWRGAGAGGTLSLALAPAISVSSNAMKKPGQWRREMLQLWGSALYTRPLGKVDWLAGVAHDQRFGDARYYPLLGVRWTGGRTRLRLTYPDLLLEREWGAGWAAILTTTPDGGLWRIYDQDLDDGTDLVREGWQSELQLRKRWRQRLETTLSLGYLWHQRWAFRRQDGERVRLDSENTPTVGVHFRWLFPPGTAAVP